MNDQYPDSKNNKIEAVIRKEEREISSCVSSHFFFLFSIEEHRDLATVEHSVNRREREKGILNGRKIISRRKKSICLYRIKFSRFEQTLELGLWLGVYRVARV